MVTREIMRDYFHCEVSEFGFQDLHDLVISKNNCVLCGTCMSICPRIGMNENQPVLIDYDPECSLCFKYCAKTYFPKELFDKEIFTQNSKKDPLIGSYQEIVSAKSTDKSILTLAQNGGVVTTLLIHALEKGLIDGALITGKDENWMPKPIIAKTTKELRETTGSIYALAPTLITYNDAVNKHKLKNLAFVGMPCQIQAARKLQFFPPLSDEFGKIRLIIGLYCTSNYSYDSMKDIIQKEIGVPLNKVKKLDVSQGKFIVYTKEGSIKETPIKKLKKFSWSSCQFCKDYTAEYADISVGSIGVLENSWNSVIIRSDVGMDLFNDALKSKKIVRNDQIDISKIKDSSLRKKSKVIEVNNKVISAMQLFNVSELEAMTYATLLSLEHANLPTLSRVMKSEQADIQNAIDKLEKRNWISFTDGFFKAISPVIVFKEEINRLKIKFFNNLKEFKSEALKELETVYLQNNLQNQKEKEFINFFF